MPALAAYFHATAAPPDPSLTARNSALHSILDNDFYPGLPDPRSIHARDVVPGIIPTYLRRDGPSPGVVVAIVLGSIAGALLVLWVLWTLTQNARTTVTGEEEIVVRRPRRNSNSHRSRRTTRSEVREFSRSPRRSGGRSAVIVEERRGGPRMRSVVVEERSRVPGDDVVEVIEEHDDYRERRTRRGSTYR